jgi:phosphatidylglycerol:prolipoprotein diacylglycerol transferase
MVGFALATFVLRRETRRDGHPPSETMTAALWMLPASLIGARALHVIVEQPAYYLDHPLDVLSPVGGWVFYGGAIGGVLAVASWARAAGRDPWMVLDRFAVATAFGLIFGRIGCLGGGCCYGRPTDLPWAVTYTRRGQIPEELMAVPLHPSPLYELALSLALFVGLSALRARRRRAGEAFLAFLVVYGLGRSAHEVLRADVERGLFLGGWLSTTQIVGLVSAAVAGALWARR